MATLKELYKYLETASCIEHLDRKFSYSEFSPEEQPKARLEILTWWKIDRVVEDRTA